MLRISDPIRERDATLLLRSVSGERESPAELRQRSRHNLFTALHGIPAVKATGPRRLLKSSRIRTWRTGQADNLHSTPAALGFEFHSASALVSVHGWRFPFRLRWGVILERGTVIRIRHDAPCEAIFTHFDGISNRQAILVSFLS